MFDISLGELAVIGAVALVVIGPEKLPKVARTAGVLFGRAQRLAAGFRADLERELHASEVADLQQQMAMTAADLRDEMAESAASVSTALSAVEPVVQPVPPAAAVPSLPDKPKRSRKKAAPVVDAVPVDVIPEVTVAQKTPRKRKAAEPQADLFAETPTQPLPDAGDRR